MNYILYFSRDRHLHKHSFFIKAPTRANQFSPLVRTPWQTSQTFFLVRVVEYSTVSFHISSRLQRSIHTLHTLHMRTAALLTTNSLACPCPCQMLKCLSACIWSSPHAFSFVEFSHFKHSTFKSYRYLHSYFDHPPLLKNTLSSTPLQPSTFPYIYLQTSIKSFLLKHSTIPSHKTNPFSSEWQSPLNTSL